MWLLRSENLTHLGGPMGTEYTTTNWRKYFTKFQYARDYAEQDYGQSLTWHSSNEDGSVRSDDLGSVMYHITRINVEK